MKITCDSPYNIAYIALQEPPAEVNTIHVGEDVNVDIAADGTVYGIELLNAKAQLLGDEDGRLVVVDEAAGASSELRLAM